MAAPPAAPAAAAAGPDAHKELKSVLQRSMSGRDSDTTLDTPASGTKMDKPAAPLAPPKQQRPLMETLKIAGYRALGGGLPGAMAMGIQVTSLMWLRTYVVFGGSCSLCAAPPLCETRSSFSDTCADLASSLYILCLLCIAARSTVCLASPRLALPSLMPARPSLRR